MNSSKTHSIKTIVMIIVATLHLAACGSTRDESVWNSYEYRYAPPSVDNDAGYTAPQGYGGYGSQDNDSAYTAPSGGGMCNVDNPQMCL